jgi:hypothetical protein
MLGHSLSVPYLILGSPPDRGVYRWQALVLAARALSGIGNLSRSQVSAPKGAQCPPPTYSIVRVSVCARCSEWELPPQRKSLSTAAPDAAVPGPVAGPWTLRPPQTVCISPPGTADRRRPATLHFAKSRKGVQKMHANTGSHVHGSPTPPTSS